MIGSSIFNTDELREELNRSELDTDWSKRYWMTKNIARVEDVANGVVEGGEKRDESTENSIPVQTGGE